MNFGPSYRSGEVPYMSYQFCAEDIQDVLWHTNSFYSPKQSNMSPTATPNSTTLQGAWPATSMYRPSRFRFPMAHPAAYGSYTASSSGSRTPEWPGQVGNS
ncbi:hypothetical protein CHS0354_031465 [Potamilus streckersoni]|uniref:Uncharacterized protein n=1 Tax=Potamilus streckersoni TaxID=2493646 RepID=A0AAE0SHT0_9BIVA|nr:hypothetical protein CHS0354_031465 [Potamilus streckersoni]